MRMLFIHYFVNLFLE